MGKSRAKGADNMSENNKVRCVKVQWAGYKKNGKWSLLEGDDKAGEKQTWFNKGKDWVAPELVAGQTYNFLVGEDAHHILYINGIEGQTPQTAPEAPKLAEISTNAPQKPISSPVIASNSVVSSRIDPDYLVFELDIIKEHINQVITYIGEKNNGGTK